MRTEEFPTLRVLVVDDDEMSIDLTVEVLRAAGVQRIDTAREGREALQRLEPDTDLLVCDLNMPGMDGMALMGALARTAFRGSLILTTGEDSQILRSAGELAGAHSLTLLGVLPKPMTPGQLLQLLTRYERDPSPVPVQVGPAVDVPSLRDAISAGRLTVYYQPKVDFGSRRIVGFEALVRWLDPVEGVIGPDQFIPLAEDSGLITPLTSAVVAQVIADAPALLIDRGTTISVNLSPVSLRDKELPDQLAAMLATADLAPNRLLLEITESRLLDDLPVTLEVISRLRLKGFHLSIDDFGTGYSGMQHLNRLPLSELKVDKSFVQASPGDHAARVIVEAAVELGRKLDLTVVAEGVETVEEWELMTQLGVGVAQGFHISRPMPKDEAVRWMSRWTGAVDSPAHEIYDPAPLRSIIGSDPAKEARFLNKFVDQALVRRDALDEAVNQDDPAALQDLGHQLKSTAKGVGALELAHVSVRIEQAGRQHELAVAGDLLAEFDDALERFRREAGVEPAQRTPNPGGGVSSISNG